MGVFGAVVGCSGDAGFSCPFLGARSGDAGFNVAMLSRLVREKVRPAWPGVGASAKKFALHAQNTPKSAFLRLLGELIRGRAAGEAVLGELFRGNVAGGAVLGEFFRGPVLVGSRGASCVVPRAWSLGPSTGSANPSIRSYTHLAEAGRVAPTGLSNPPRNAKRRQRKSALGSRA